MDWNNRDIDHIFPVSQNSIFWFAFSLSLKGMFSLFCIVDSQVRKGEDFSLVCWLSLTFIKGGAQLSK
jgi:hypothetical protein